MFNPLTPIGRATRITYAIGIILIAFLHFLTKQALGSGDAPALEGAKLLFMMAIGLAIFSMSSMRLHDSGRNLLLALVPLFAFIFYIGFSTMASSLQGEAIDSAHAVSGVMGVTTIIMVVIIACLPPEYGPNRFGWDPREGKIAQKTPELHDVTPEQLNEHPDIINQNHED